MKSIINSLYIFLLGLALQSCSKIGSITPDSVLFRQFEMNEWTIHLDGIWDTHPYDQREIKVDLLFTDESGQTSILPCFYVSGECGKESIWKARFAPKNLGKNKLQIRLSQKGEVIETKEYGTIFVESSSAHGILHIADNWAFTYDDSTAFRGIGENICWESRDADDSKFFKALHEDSTRFNYDYMLSKLAKQGGNFFRMWMIYWNMPIDWKQPENNSRYTEAKNEFNESAMERMDHVVRLCDSLDIHMMLALDAHGSLLDRGWELSRYNAENGGPAASPAEFFTNPEAKQMYKDKLRLLVARYGYSPSIAVWEFFNEIDNVLYADAAEGLRQEDITAWHQEMAEYLKATDPYHHIITTSISHRDIEGMNDIKAMDLNQRHIYCAIPTIPATIRSLEAKHQKPYVIGEQGYHWDWSLNFNDYEAEFAHDYRHALWLGLFSPTPILPMSWWWEFFEEKGTSDYLSVVRKVNDLILEAGTGEIEEIECQKQDETTALALRAGDKLFVYLHNDEEKAASLGTTIIANGSSYQVSRISTDTGEIAELGTVITQRNGSLFLPAEKLGSKQDVIYQLDLIK